MGACAVELLFLIINECQKWFRLIVGFFSTFPLTLLSYFSKIVGV